MVGCIMIVRKQSRSQRKAIIKANKAAPCEAPLKMQGLRNNWQRFESVAKVQGARNNQLRVYAQPKSDPHERVGLLIREGLAK